jgi:hypothetical protein
MTNVHQLVHGRNGVGRKYDHKVRCERGTDIPPVNMDEIALDWNHYTIAYTVTAFIFRVLTVWLLQALLI